MSNVNNWAFAKQLDQFKLSVIDPQKKRVDDASKIIHDQNYQWKDDDTRKIALAKYDNMKQWLAYYESFHEEGMKLVTQHEALVNKMSKIYDSWYDNISDNGFQGKELMSEQAEILSGLMEELYKELLPLGLPNIKPPAAMNLK